MTGVQLTFRSDSPEQTQSIAATLARHLRGGDCIALEGDLGAGKTVFVRGLAEGLGIDPRSVSSPTFMIRQEYVDERSSDSPTLVHIDAYRVSGPDDLETIGWSELLNDDGAIVAIEWPSRILSSLPRQRIEVHITHTGEHARDLVINATDAATDRLKELQLGTPEDNCRKCGKRVQRTNISFPFCSERCRLADLNAWFKGGYRVSRTLGNDEELSE